MLSDCLEKNISVYLLFMSLELGALSQVYVIKQLEKFMSTKDTRTVTRDEDGHLDKVIIRHETDKQIVTKVYEAEPGLLGGVTEGHKVSETREEKNKS